MTPAIVAAATVAGGCLGAVGGAGAVLVERVERLEEEENEERLAHERDVAEGVEGAGRPGDWEGDRYGWTWLERVLAPALGAVSFGLFAAHEGGGASLLVHLLWLAVFVHIVVVDLKHRLILNRVTYPAVVLALALAAVTPGMSVLRALTGAALVAAFFLVQSVISRGRIGIGDAKLGALVGAVTGLSVDGGQTRALYAVVYAVFLGGAVAMGLLVTRLRGLKDPIPYGPFLCAGAALVLYQSPS